jgi:hypothetical protein
MNKYAKARFLTEFVLFHGDQEYTLYIPRTMCSEKSEKEHDASSMYIGIKNGNFLYYPDKNCIEHLNRYLNEQCGGKIVKTVATTHLTSRMYVYPSAKTPPFLGGARPF